MFLVVIFQFSLSPVFVSRQWDRLRPTACPLTDDNRLFSRFPTRVMVSRGACPLYSQESVDRFFSGPLLGVSRKAP